MGLDLFLMKRRLLPQKKKVLTLNGDGMIDTHPFYFLKLIFYDGFKFSVPKKVLRFLDPLEICKQFSVRMFI